MSITEITSFARVFFSMKWPRVEMEEPISKSTFRVGGYFWVEVWGKVIEGQV
jgi:hypothetical protein